MSRLQGCKTPSADCNPAEISRFSPEVADFSENGCNPSQKTAENRQVARLQGCTPFRGLPGLQPRGATSPVRPKRTMRKSKMQTERTCSFCESTAMSIGISWTIRGDPIHPWYCRTCGKVETRYASKRDAAAWAADHGALQRVKTATMEKIEAGEIDVSQFDHMKPCEVCGERGTTELHHWAPWYLFDAEAEKWPKSFLCRDCHQRWHRLVTPGMGNRKAAK